MTQIIHFQSLKEWQHQVSYTKEQTLPFGLVDIEEFHEPEQNNISNRIVLNSNLNWLLTDSVITKFFPHTTSSFSKMDREDDNDISSFFWSIYEKLENGNGKTGTVNHSMLHEALVTSGKFYGGEAMNAITFFSIDEGSFLLKVTNSSGDRLK